MKPVLKIIFLIIFLSIAGEGHTFAVETAVRGAVPKYCDAAFGLIGLKSKNFPQADFFQSERLNYKTELHPKIIPNGSIVEGSASYGGIQPHYRIDYTHPDLKTYLDFAKNLKNNPMPVEEKIKMLIAETNRRLPGRWYVDLKYLRLLRKHIKSQTPVNFGEYFAAGVGVCRENALAMHLALQEAGISSKFLYTKIYRTVPGTKVLEDHAFNTVIVDGKEVVVDAYFSTFNGKSLSSLKQHRLPHDQAGVIEQANYPLFHIPQGKEQEAAFTLTGPKGENLHFKIASRTQAEQRFKTEEEQYLRAGLEDEVNIEWIFHPVYGPLGHTSLRIGNRSFEFTKSGWKIHDNGADSARAFLFSNPFFKAQYEAYKDRGIPPFSIGIPVRMKKKKVLEMENNIKNEQAENKAFSIISRNCNQCMLKILPSEERDAIEGGPYSNFSSVITFRKLLLNSPVKTAPANIYPLSGLDPILSFKELMPKYLYESHTEFQELLRVIKESPILLGF